MLMDVTVLLSRQRCRPGWRAADTNDWLLLAVTLPILPARSARKHGRILIPKGRSTHPTEGSVLQFETELADVFDDMPGNGMELLEHWQTI